MKCLDQRLQKFQDRFVHLTENQRKTDQALDESIEGNSSSPSGSVSEDEMSSKEESEEKLIIELYGDNDKTECKKEMKYLMYLRAKLETYCSLLPVLGFNISKYDLQLTRKRFSEKPIVAFANCTVFIQDIYLTKPVWSHVLASSAWTLKKTHIVSCE